MKKSICIAAASLSMIGAIGSANAAGWVDRAHVCVVSGWACDEADPSYTGSVLIYLDDGRLIRKLTANKPREAAVGASCGGNSARGFAGDLDTTPGNTFASGYHGIHVYFERRNGSLLEIGGSPTTVLFGPAQVSPGPQECLTQPNGWGN